MRYNKFALIALLYLNSSLGMESTTLGDEFLNFTQKSNSEYYIPEKGYHQLISEFFKPKITPVEIPNLYIFAGGPGSGKTKFRNQDLKNSIDCSKNYYIHDVPTFYVSLKTYYRTNPSKQSTDNSEGIQMSDLTPEVLWPCAQKIANQFADFAVSKKFNIVYERTCCSIQSFNFIQNTIKNGYKTTMHCVCVPLDIAYQRSEAESKITGIPYLPCQVEFCTRKFSELFEKYVQLLPKNISLWTPQKDDTNHMMCIFQTVSKELSKSTCMRFYTSQTVKPMMTYSDFFSGFYTSSYLKKWAPCFTDFWPVAPTQLDSIQNIAIILGSEHFIIADDFIQDAYIQGFELLRVFKTLGDHSYRRLSRHIITQWIQNYHILLPHAHFLNHPIIMSQRLANWVGFFDFFGQSAPDDFRKFFLKNILLHYTILQKTLLTLQCPIEYVLALKGVLIISGSMNDRHSFLRYLKEYQKKLDRVLKAIDTKNDSIANSVLIVKDLIEIRMILRALDYPDPPIFEKAFSLLVPFIRFLRHGDGHLSALMGHPSSAVWALYKTIIHPPLIDAILSLADVTTRLSAISVKLNYVRLHFSFGLVIMNTMPGFHGLQLDHMPPDASAILGGLGIPILQFEWSLGCNRIIHMSDIVLQDYSGQERIMMRIDTPEIESKHQNNHIHLKSYVRGLTHDQSDSLPITLSRAISLDPSGQFSGSDQLTCSAPTIIAIRFILGRDTTILPHSNYLNLCVETPTRKKNTKRFFKFQANSYDELVCHHWDGYHIIFLLKKMDTLSHQITWSFTPIEDS